MPKRPKERFGSRFRWENRFATDFRAIFKRSFIKIADKIELRIDRALRELQAGVIKINAPTTGTELHAPFGGDKASSGHAAREQGDTAVDFFTRTRTAYIRPGRPV